MWHGKCHKSLSVTAHADSCESLRSWVASAPYDDRFIGITARHWSLVDTGLVTVTDFPVYAAGTAENAARARRRHTDAD